jgi:hypothetical protein
MKKKICAFNLSFLVFFSLVAKVFRMILGFLYKKKKRLLAAKKT